MRVYLGIDWSESKHDAVFLNEPGVVQARLTFPHSADGFEQLDRLRERLGVAAGDCWVGLETAHNMLIDFLWAKGYRHVFVTPPHLIQGNRGRQSGSGAHTDQTDGWLIADTVRTDQAHLRPWHPDSLLVQQLRAQVSLVVYLTRQSVGLHNRLRSVLLRYYPAALQVFSDLMAPISLAFIYAYPTPQAASQLSYAEFADFARQHQHHQPAKWPACYARLQAQQPTAAETTVEVYQAEAMALAPLLLASVQAKRQTLRELQAGFERHPDAAIFRSLPGAGGFLAPALLAKFGEDRQRFPEPVYLQSLAGTCPVTEASGKRRWVHYRQACDHEFRYIAQLWAKESLRHSPFAVAYYEQVRPRCDSDSHAYRCLANRWLAIAWKLWQSRQPYDETWHLQQRAARSQPKP